MIVRITIKNTSGSSLEELSLVDRIPAGWEIENQAFGRGEELSAHTNGKAWNSEYSSFRDNRVEVFGDLKANETVQVLYSVRATSVGTFTIPPVHIEAMYDDSMWARQRGSHLNVSGDKMPWANSLL